MLKLTMTFLILMSFIACDKGHNYSKKKRFIVTDTMKEELLEKEIAANRISTCKVKKNRKNIVEKILSPIFGLLTQRQSDKFDLVYPQALTHKIMTDMKKHILKTESFSPENFWFMLSNDARNELNQLLIKKFLKHTDEEFLQVRQMVAFSFLFYFQEKIRRKSYEVHFTNGETLGDVKLDKVRFAFTENAKFKKRKKLALCEKADALGIKFTEAGDFLRPSDINGRVKCSADNSFVKIDLVRNNVVTLTFRNTAYRRKISLDMGDFEINFSGRRANFRYLQDGNEIIMYGRKLKKEDGDLYLSKGSIISVESTLNDGARFNMPKLKCSPIKPLKLN